MARPSRSVPPSSTDRPGWVPAFRTEELPIGRPRVLKHGGRQIALFRSDTGLHALDNLCPHEGYPLAQGVVRDCTLTCAWHNFKFDLRDGRSLVGEEPVRAYPVRERDGRVEVDLTDPDPATLIPGRLASLEEGMHERSLDRMARDVVRLLRLGVAPESIALAGARFDARRARFGSGHAVAVAADLLPLLERHPASAAALPLVHLLDLASEESARRAPHPEPAPIDPGSEPEAAERRFLAALEAERVDEAQGLVSGALARGLGRATLEPWLLRFTTRHFIGFGHGLIYTVKAFDLLERVGFEHAPELLPGLVRRLARDVRHDTLPTWGGFRRFLAQAEPRLTGWSACGSGAADAGDREVWARAVLDGRGADGLVALAAALDAGAPTDALCDALAIAAAERMLRFDAALDASVEVQEGWLDVSHVQTFAHAVRRALPRLPGPARLRWLFQAAAFVRHQAPLDGAHDGFPFRAPAAMGSEPGALADALDARDATRAVASAAAFLGRGGAADELRAVLEDRALRDPSSRPIVTAHHLKNTRVAFEEHVALGDHPLRFHPLLAAVRLVASPIPTRRIPQHVREAIDFVERGRKPRALTG